VDNGTEESSFLYGVPVPGQPAVAVTLSWASLAE
jgi:hypothetical protein